MKKISIITPIYGGKMFIDSIIDNAKKLFFALSKFNYKVELVCVNDKPDDILNFKNISSIEFKYIINPKNMGIQQSRVNGLRISTGDYIIFLDQDDQLVTQNYISQVEKMEYADVVVGNLYKDVDGKKKLLYKNKRILNFLTKEKTLIDYVNTIISPGQCLIKKNVIPDEWCNSIMKTNGADDWLLWLLLYNCGAKFAINENAVYYHRTTSIGNLSSDTNNMYKSEKEMLDILKKCNYPKWKIKEIEKTITLNHTTFNKFSKNLVKKWYKHIYYKGKQAILRL